MGIQVSPWDPVFISFGCIPKSWIAESYGSFIFQFLSNFHTVFHSTFTNLHSHQQLTRVSFSTQLYQYLLSLVFLMIAILTSVWWYLTEILLCISLMISDVKHLFKDRLLSEKQRNIEYKLWGHFYKNIYIYLCQKPKNVQTTVQLRSFHMLASYAQNPSSWASAVHEPRISRGTTQVLKRQRNQNIHWIMEKEREFQKNIYFCLIEYAKAIDCVYHNKLWKIIKEMGIPDHLTCLLRNLYTGQEAAVRTRHGKMDWFKIGRGIRQGCILSLCLFNLYVSTSCEMPGGWITSWNQDCQEKYQEPQICRWYHSNGGK